MSGKRDGKMVDGGPTIVREAWVNEWAGNEFEGLKST
jgi:hypothetical protein